MKRALSAQNHKYGNMGNMKTTLELPDLLFRKAKATAATRGISLKELFTSALEDKLAVVPPSAKPAWMEGFGKLKRLRGETKRIQSVITREFGVVEPEDRE